MTRMLNPLEGIMLLISSGEDKIKPAHLAGFIFK